MLFRVKLKAIHDKTELSAYAVAKQTGLSQATVRKYVDNDVVESEYLHSVIITLAKFYGVDWRDPDVVEVINEEAPEGQIETSLAVPA